MSPTEQRSRPAGNQAAHKISGGDTPIVSSGPDKIGDTTLTETQISDLVCSNTKARDVYFAGYLAGHREGSAAAELNAEQAAGLAARRFYALETCDVDTRRLVQHTASWADVEAARSSMLGGA